MAIDRGGFRRRHGGHVPPPPPKNTFLWVLFCPEVSHASSLTSYPGFTPDRYKLFVVFSLFTIHQVFFITVVGILND